MIKRFLLAALLALFAAQIAVMLGEKHWFFELFTHYPHYYAIGAILVILFATRERMWKTALIATMIFAINMPALTPYLSPTCKTTETCKILPGEDSQPENLGPAQKSAQEQNSLTILANNFYYRNTKLPDFRILIEEEDPDIFIIHEASSLWLTESDYYDNTYPYYAHTEELGIPGIFVFSRIPGEFREVPLGTSVGLEFIPENLGGTQDSVQESFAILAVHPPAPIGSKLATERNAQFNDIAVYAQESELPVIAIGDYNSSPWSPYFQQLLASSGLRDTRLDFGFIPTWHAHNPLFSIPIDHALASPALNITEFRTTAKTASDHLPILVKLSLP